MTSDVVFPPEKKSNQIYSVLGCFADKNQSAFYEKENGKENLFLFKMRKKELGVSNVQGQKGPVVNNTNAEMNLNRSRKASRRIGQAFVPAS